MWAETEGFEPSRGVNPYIISSDAHSASLARLRRVYYMSGCISLQMLGFSNAPMRAGRRVVRQLSGELRVRRRAWRQS